MSLFIEKHLRCDGPFLPDEGCYESFGVDSRTDWKSLKALRLAAQNNGWGKLGGKDLCPFCFDKAAI